MNTQQKIDALNTIINERESAVWLKEILQDALKYLDELGTRDSRLKELDNQITSKQTAMDGLAKKYQAKEEAFERELANIRDTHETSRASLIDQHQQFQDQLAAQKEALTASITALQDRLAKAQEAEASAVKKQGHAEGAMQKAIRQYEEYKASLK